VELAEPPTEPVQQRLELTCIFMFGGEKTTLEGEEYKAAVVIIEIMRNAPIPTAHLWV